MRKGQTVFHASQSGFTLIEVVIAVAIFMSVAVVTFKISNTDVFNSEGTSAFEQTRFADAEMNAIHTLAAKYSDPSRVEEVKEYAYEDGIHYTDRQAYTSGDTTVYYTFRRFRGLGACNHNHADRVCDSANTEITNAAGNVTSAMLQRKNVEMLQYNLLLYKQASGGTPYMEVPLSTVKDSSGVSSSLGTTHNALKDFIEEYYPFILHEPAMGEITCSAGCSSDSWW
ncbi:MAG: prepilin-type N-terminal cleavage/methylation domain-containing protein [Vampirovibrionales bacterium]